MVIFKMILTFVVVVDFCFFVFLRGEGVWGLFSVSNNGRVEN